jgi:hypothetical protein
MAANLTTQVRAIPRSPPRLPRGDLSKKITVDAHGGDPRAQEHHQHDGRIS